MSRIVKQRRAAVYYRLGSPRAPQGRQRVFQSQASHRLLLRRTHKWQPPPQRLTHFKLTTVTDPNGNTTTTTYNGLNEPVSVTNETCGCSGMSGTTTYGYNDIGEQTTVTDPYAHIKSYTYDGQGRTLTETDPNTGVTSYSYGLDGNQTAETDPDGNTTTYSYNAADELTSTTQPQAASHPATNAYNAAGELTSATDADGRTITYAYDNAGQMTSETWVGGSYTATYNYNTDGELTSVSDPYSTYTYTYNALGQQTSVSNAGTPGVPTVTLSSGYDDFGNRTSLTDSLGGSISYAYNTDDEMTSLGLSVSGTLDAQVTFAYDGAGNVTGITRTAPSASGSHTIATSMSYNHSNEVTNITDTDTTASVTLASYTYGYNPAGVLTSSQDNSGNSLTYGYDANDELTSATGTLASKSYTFTYNYDVNGNRTSTTTDVNGTLTSATYSTTKNELTNDGTYSYTYDNNGNTATQTNLSTGSVTYYSWDYENRLTEVKEETSTGTVLNDEKFTYDVFGNRIGVSLNGTQQLYTVYDGSNPYMDFNGSGTLAERYLTNPNSLNQFYGQVSGSGTTQWLLTDNLGSIQQVVNTGGTALDTIIYDPYGSIISQTNSANAPRFLYTGAAYDPITGTYLDGAREDNPTDGRWLSQDPLGFARGDTNLYQYVANQPTDLFDPSGMQPYPDKPNPGETPEGFCKRVWQSIQDLASEIVQKMIDIIRDEKYLQGGGATPGGKTLKGHQLQIEGLQTRLTRLLKGWGKYCEDGGNARFPKPAPKLPPWISQLAVLPVPSPIPRGKEDPAPDKDTAIKLLQAWGKFVYQATHPPAVNQGPIDGIYHDVGTEISIVAGVCKVGSVLRWIGSALFGPSIPEKKPQTEPFPPIPQSKPIPPVQQPAMPVGK